MVRIPVGGPTDVYYRINNGSIQSVSKAGQPRITTPGDNTLEYWSVDNAGIEETPHKMLTGIKLGESSAANSSFTTNEQQIAYTIVLSLMVVVLAVVLSLRRMRRLKHPTLPR